MSDSNITTDYAAELPSARRDTREQRIERDIRQTRIAVQVIAWVMSIFAVLAAIIGIIAAVQLHHVAVILANLG